MNPSNSPRANALFGLCAAAVFFTLVLGAFFAAQTLSPNTDDTPRPTKPLRLIHSHGSRSEPVDTAPRDVPQTPTAANAITAWDDALEPDAPSRYFDDGRPDPLSGRETAFDRWTLDNAEIWDEMDPQLQDCTYTSYVNAFGRSPEAGIDWCLAQAERADAEAMDQ